MGDQNNHTRILIATAGFGEGHNSAAKGLKDALGSDEIAQIIDPCALAAPRINQQIKTAYKRVTTHNPSVWKQIYKACGNRDFMKERLPFMKKVREKVGELVEEKEVEALLSTYFIYPYFLERYVQRRGRRVPVFTVVTDSIEINAAWFKAPCDHWFVTDQFTRLKLISFGLSPRVVHEFGFPIHPRFTQLQPLSIQDRLEEFRVLLFPTAKRPHVTRLGRAALQADPRVKLTLVLGRNVRLLYHKAIQLKREFPHRVRIVGWTQRVPELLCTHHLVLAKAGGATVHEAIAANCPMLVHHVVPGQEEGNLALLRAGRCGEFVSSPGEVTKMLQKMLLHQGALWRSQKELMHQISKPDAARTISDFVLNEIST